MRAVIVEHAFMNNNDIKAVDILEKRNIMRIAVVDGIYKIINESFKGWVEYKENWKFYDLKTNYKKIG